MPIVCNCLCLNSNPTVTQSLRWLCLYGSVRQLYASSRWLATRGTRKISNGHTDDEYSSRTMNIHETMQPPFCESAHTFWDRSISWTIRLKISLTFCTHPNIHRNKIRLKISLTFCTHTQKQTGFWACMHLWQNMEQGSHYLLILKFKDFQELSRTLKFHFQGSILDGGLQHDHCITAIFNVY